MGPHCGLSLRGGFDCPAPLWNLEPGTVKLQSVLRLCSEFYRSKDPTNSIKVLKELTTSKNSNKSALQATDIKVIRECEDMESSNICT